MSVYVEGYRDCPSSKQTHGRPLSGHFGGRPVLDYRVICISVDLESMTRAGNRIQLALNRKRTYSGNNQATTWPRIKPRTFGLCSEKTESNFADAAARPAG